MSTDTAKRVTVDTNVLISGTFWRGASYKILLKAQNKQIHLVLSRSIIKEYSEVLEYPEILKKVELKNLNAWWNVEKITAMSTIVYPQRKITVIKDDPSDNVILECAAEGRVDNIISSDNHLLSLKEFESTPIMSPEEFLKYLKC